MNKGGKFDVLSLAFYPMISGHRTYRNPRMNQVPIGAAMMGRRLGWNSRAIRDGREDYKGDSTAG